MVQVILCISEHVIDGCFLINVYKNDYSKLSCVARSFFEFGYHLKSKLTTSFLCDRKCWLFLMLILLLFFFSELSYNFTSFDFEAELQFYKLRF